LPSNKPALANLPEDEEKFPVAVWLKRWFLGGVRRLQLNPRVLREPCPARASEELDLNGSNLPKVVQRLKESDPRRFAGWLGHVQQELGEVEDIEVRLRPEDNARYLMLRGRDGYAVPQWGVSEGSLRFLALTLLTYLPEEEGTVWLIEEPENGIHPQALESVLQALTTLYDSQVLIATHSALMLEFDELVRPEHLLCFSLQEGQTVIRSGGDVLAPLEREGSSLTLGDLMAWGVLSR
jgi:predicted ATPase